jgi:hypothetical protein
VNSSPRANLKDVKGSALQPGNDEELPCIAEPLRCPLVRKWRPVHLPNRISQFVTGGARHVNSLDLQFTAFVAQFDFPDCLVSRRRLFTFERSEVEPARDERLLIFASDEFYVAQEQLQHSDKHSSLAVALGDDFPAAIKGFSDQRSERIDLRNQRFHRDRRIWEIRVPIHARINVPCEIP